jgi:tetratricopeptide (TPR) repeat protein
LSEPYALYAAAVVQWRARRRDEAIKLIDEALRLRPDFAAALCMGGYMLSECGKPEPAQRFYRRALELDASLIVAHINAGKLYFGAGRFDEALRSFEAATALAPDDPDAWSSRAGSTNRSKRLDARFRCATISRKPRSTSATRF